MFMTSNQLSVLLEMRQRKYVEPTEDWFYTEKEQVEWESWCKEQEKDQ